MKPIATPINRARLAVIQGVYFLITGIWPILHMSSFLAVTGPKVDLWLVRTVGMLIFFCGAGLSIAGIKRQVNVPVIIIATGTAFGLLVVDVTYVWLQVISSIYLLDAVVELIFLVVWILLLVNRNGRQKDFSL